MPYLYVFAGPDLQRLATTTLAHTEFQLPYGEGTTSRPLFNLVKDGCGVYLISGYTHEPKDRIVVYPVKEACVNELAGDASVDSVPVRRAMIRKMARGERCLVISISEELEGLSSDESECELGLEPGVVRELEIWTPKHPPQRRRAASAQAPTPTAA